VFGTNHRWLNEGPTTPRRGRGREGRGEREGEGW